MNQSDDDIIGLIPMAGQGSRLGKMPFSKELYPITLGVGGNSIPVSSFLIENMKMAGVNNYHLILRDGKWDIPAFLGSGKDLNVNFCYHIAQYGYGVPFTVNQAYPFIKNKTVVFGFPDILITAQDAFTRLLKKLNDTDTAVVLGSIAVNNPESWDMIELSENGFVSKIHIKPKKVKNLKYNWVIAVWKPVFTKFLNLFVENLLLNNSKSELEEKEYHMGDILNLAIDSGISVNHVIFSEGKCLDIGTPDGMKQIRNF